MLWAGSKNAKRRLEAIVEAMDENIENKWLFLLENYHNSLGLKGFSHNCTSSLRTASFYSTGTYAQPCTNFCQEISILFTISSHFYLSTLCPRWEMWQNLSHSMKALKKVLLLYKSFQKPEIIGPNNIYTYSCQAVVSGKKKDWSSQNP